MKKIIFYPIAAIAFLLASCEKGMDLNLDFSNFNFGSIVFNSNTFDTTAISYIQLPTTRYFIYKDEVSGSIDSVRVTGNNLSWVYVNAVGTKPGYFYETFELTLTSFSVTGNQTWYKGYAGCDSDYKNIATFIDGDFSLSNEPSKLPAFWYPFRSTGLQQYTQIPALVIEGTTYNEVHKFFVTNGLPPSDTNYLESTFYWVKGIGIIKKEIRTFNSVKTSLLVRYG